MRRRARLTTEVQRLERLVSGRVKAHRTRPWHIAEHGSARWPGRDCLRPRRPCRFSNAFTRGSSRRWVPRVRQGGHLTVPVSAFQGAVLPCNEHQPCFSAAAATRTIWLKPNSRPSKPRFNVTARGMPWKPARHCTAAKKRTKEGDMSIGEVTSRLASTSQ